jgi:hypothetical protein
MVAASGTRTAEPEVTYVASWLELEILKPVVRIALARKLLVRLNAKHAMRVPSTPMQLDSLDAI